MQVSKRLSPYRVFIRIVLIIILIGTPLILWYSIFFEPSWIQVTRFDVVVPGLPPSLDGTKIVQMSDLHRSRLVKDSNIKKAIRLANSERPDVVVLTGDFVSRNADNAGPCAEMLSELKSKWGSYAVLGNHDHWTDASKVASHLRAHDIQLLKNENVMLAPGLYLIGLDDLWAGNPNVTKAWNGVNETSGQIVLSHSPLAVDLFRNKKCFAITGHTHGGQVKIPLVHRSKLPGLRGWKYIDGWYNVDEVQMYVNRGIGMVNPALRFLCRPEVSVFTLQSE